MSFSEVNATYVLWLSEWLMEGRDGGSEREGKN